MKNLYDNLDDNRKTWRNLNSIIFNRDSSPPDTCSVLNFNGQSLSNKYEISSAFNYHFATVADTIKDSIRLNSVLSMQPNHSPVIKRSFVSPACTPDEINLIIEKLSNFNAKDAYGLTNKLIKIHRVSLTPILSQLINTSLSESTFPSPLKLAIVKPLFKGGDKKNPSNYRPISILPIFGKIFEAVLLRRLSNHLSANELIDDAQFAFVDNSNTETACLHFLSSIYRNIENKLFTAIQFIDISKAFDCVDFEILIGKLNELELTDCFFKVFKSYFCNRRQFVNLNDFLSPVLKSNSGVPQGSIIGPLLFIFYINSVFKFNLKGRLQLYADDTTIVYGEVSFAKLKESMEADLKLISFFLHTSPRSKCIKN